MGVWLHTCMRRRETRLRCHSESPKGTKNLALCISLLRKWRFFAMLRMTRRHGKILKGCL